MSGRRAPHESQQALHHPSRRRALLVLVGVLAAVAVAVSVFLGVQRPSGATAATTAESAQAAIKKADNAPTVNPKLQRWMVQRGVHEVALNNALVQVLGRASAKGDAALAPCKVLATVTGEMIAMPAAPYASIDKLARAGLQELKLGAQACIAGQPSAAVAHIRTGLKQRQVVSGELDNAIEGE